MEQIHSQTNEGQPADPLLTAAREHFNLSYLFPYQRLVIHNILEAAANPESSRSRQMVILPTGAGKSLCFSLPGVLLTGGTLIVYPLLGLMADQARRFESAGQGCAVLKGGLSPQDRQTIWQKWHEGKIRFLLTNPEALASKQTMTELSQTPPEHAVVDEAHTVVQWGDSFRPSYAELGKTLGALNVPILTAFTATASPAVLKRIGESLFLNQPFHKVIGNPDRQNIHYSVIPTLTPEAELERLLSPMSPEALPRPAIIFCRSRDSARLTAMELRHRFGVWSGKIAAAAVDAAVDVTGEQDYAEVNIHKTLSRVAGAGMAVTGKPEGGNVITPTISNPTGGVALDATGKPGGANSDMLPTPSYDSKPSNSILPFLEAEMESFQLAAESAPLYCIEPSPFIPAAESDSLSLLPNPASPIPHPYSTKPKIYYYHAGLSPEEKKEVEEWFFDSDDGILTATCAYGMGIDKSNIRTVIHLEAPETAEAYLQEAGRGGRDREQAWAVLLSPPEGTMGSTKEDESEKTTGAPMPDLISRETCRRSLLLQAMGTDQEECTGCDICDGKAVKQPMGLLALLNFLKRHPRRFTQRQLRFHLAGYGSCELLISDLAAAPGKGLLKGFNPEDIETLMSLCCQKGLIKRVKGSGVNHLKITPKGKYLLKKTKKKKPLTPKEI